MMLKTPASGVLVAFRPSTYRKGTPRAFTDCGLAGQSFWASCGRMCRFRPEANHCGVCAQI